MSQWYALGASKTLPNLVPGADGPADLSHRGEQLVIPWYQQWVHNGKVFLASNAAKQTALASGGTSYSDTAPAFLLDVPAGTTLIPLHIRLRQGGTVAGGVITVLVTADVIVRYSSGGTAITPRNMKISTASQPSSACSLYGSTTSLVAAAVNTHITLAGAILTHDVATAPNSPQNNFDYSPIANGEPAPHLVGPASLLIYTFGATTQPSWFFAFKWIEVDS